jgi:hypothetical protein
MQSAEIMAMRGRMKRWIDLESKDGMRAYRTGRRTNRHENRRNGLRLYGFIIRRSGGGHAGTLGL